ncbi:MAG: type II secretion system GspH family protein [Acidobacteriota bacterium]|nr:type II secretion system GspH family protein [Acidobacteriota bacterium]
MRNINPKQNTTTSGFSLLELIIAMTITIAVMAAASTLLATSFKIRSREDSRTDSIADVQRAMNVMSREIAIGGFGFDTVSNGLVAADCTASTLRVRSNLNRYTGTDGTQFTIANEGEDIKYLINSNASKKYLVRYDQFAASDATVLANRVDSLAFIYMDGSGTALADQTNVTAAAMVRITVGVDLPEVGTKGVAGYQAATTIDLTSDVALRNKKENIATY